MKIIICGAGLSGRAIAEKLSQIGNEVTIIDSSKNLIKSDPFPTVGKSKG